MKTLNFLGIAIILISLLAFNSCEKEEDIPEDQNSVTENQDNEENSDDIDDTRVPTVTTSQVYDITPHNAKCGGTVTSDGGLSVISRGVCWKEWGTAGDYPTLSDDKTNDGTGTGSFASEISRLSPGTRYYLRAYAQNTKGVGYGSVRSFLAPWN